MLSSAHKSLTYAKSRNTNIDHYFPEPFDTSELMNAIYDYFPNMLKPRREHEYEINTGISVLIAEDNEINVKVADTIFSRLGLKADFARNGKEAVTMVKEKNYDLVFMDILMPEYDGFQATVELRASGFTMPIVAMTATSGSKTRNRAILAGMNDYIVKPIRMDDIPNILSKWAV
jgi:CheY-like chemotaxis protein